MEVILDNKKQAFNCLKDIYSKIEQHLESGIKFKLTIESEKRSNKQNDLMWGLLTDLSNQVVWNTIKLSPNDWKNVITASLKKQRIILGIDGHMVVLGASTRDMTKTDLSNLIELVLAFGSEQGVKFRDFERETS